VGQIVNNPARDSIMNDMIRRSRSRHTPFPSSAGRADNGPSAAANYHALLDAAAFLIN